MAATQGDKIMPFIKRAIARASRLLVVSSFVVPAASQAAYPDKPVVLVVPFSAGGPTDKIARDIAESLRKPLGQTVVVDNSTGAGGTIGTARVLHAPADGYTLLIHHIGLATAPALYKKLGYKIEDLEFLGLINEAPSTLIGKQSLPAANFAELRKYIAANGGKVNLANAGIGSASHLCSLMLQSALKSDMIFVPYKGTGPAMNDLLGGQVDLMCEQATNSTPQIEARKVKAYGVTSARRMTTVPALASLPTLAESGLPGFDFSVWHGLYAPRGTPPAVVEKINAALRTALKDPELIKRQEALGITVVTDGRLAPAEHRKFFDSEVARWTKTIKDSGIQPE
jgi:tripartite-type tricarboxylate transporter receptor subunit TctC